MIPKALEAYGQNQPLVFPLIASILEGRQKGEIRVDSPENPRHFFVLNKFGFCQEFSSNYNNGFFTELKNIIRERQYKKLRLYSPSESMAEFLKPLGFAVKSKRVQFKYSGPPHRRANIKRETVVRSLIKPDLESDDLGLA